jgi:LacI family transcriptional regulator
VCDDDLLAAGAYKAAHKCRLTIPNEISITGFCDIELARVLEPELTTVHIPAKEVGTQAAQLLVDWIEHECQPEVGQVVNLPLVVRASTAPPRESSGD